MTETMPSGAATPPHAPSASAEALGEAIHGAAELVDLLRESPGTRLRIDLGELSLEIQTGTTGEPAETNGRAAATGEPAAPPPVPPTPPDRPAEPAGPPADAPAAQLHRVVAPLIGAFYRSPTPAEPPFVAVGDQVTAGQQVAIIEAMKLMNALVTDRAGVVAEIHVEDGAVVEFDQLVMTIEID